MRYNISSTRESWSRRQQITIMNTIKRFHVKKKKYKDGYDTAKTQHTRQKTYGDQGLKRIMADSNTS